MMKLLVVATIILALILIVGPKVILAAVIGIVCICWAGIGLGIQWIASIFKG